MSTIDDGKKRKRFASIARKGATSSVEDRLHNRNVSTSIDRDIDIDRIGVEKLGRICERTHQNFARAPKIAMRPLSIH